MNNDALKHYRNTRKANPFMPASAALDWAKAATTAEDGWEEDHNQRWAKEVDGFTVKLSIDEDSIFPECNSKGETDYGNYVDGNKNYEDYDWDGEWPRPAEMPPLGLPYTSIHYSGPGWTQGEEPGYFIPSGIEDQFESYRRRGQSKSVAWDLTKKWVEDQLTMLFSSPLTYVNVWVKVYKDDIKLATECMGTDVEGGGDGLAYVFTMVDEHDMVATAIDDARRNISKLVNN